MLEEEKLRGLKVKRLGGEASWEPPETSFAYLGRLLGGSWEALGVPWGPLGASWDAFWSSGRLLAALEAVLRRRCLARCGLRATRCDLEGILERSGPSLARLGRLKSKKTNLLYRWWCN